MVTTVHINSQPPLPPGPAPVLDTLEMREAELRERLEQAETLASRLELAMTLRDVKAPTLARKIRATRQMIYKVLQGKTKVVDYQLALRIAKELGIRAEWLQDGSRPMFPSPLLDDHESQLIHWYRRLDERRQGDLRSIAQTWARESGLPPSAGDPFKKSRAR